jgi:alpha-L-fucosidase 2
MHMKFLSSIRSVYFVLVLIIVSGVAAVAQQKTKLRLWYDKPAHQWEEALPLGNGRLGMTPDGGVMREKIVLNDITMWSGSVQDANNYEAYKKLPEIRKLIVEGRNDEAQALVNRDFVCKGPGSGGPQWGCYQTLADLDLQFTYGTEGDAAYTRYSRELLLDQALATARFEVGGVTYTREYFTSFDDDVMLVRLTASRPGKLNCKATLTRQERGESAIQGDVLNLWGQLDNGIDGKGVRYKTTLKARVQGGSTAYAGNTIQITKADEILFLVSAATDLKNKSFEKTVDDILKAASKKPYAQQKKNHVAAFQKLFNRLQFNLDGPQQNDVTTDERLSNFLNDRTADNGLPVLFFQFGRYLTICSTRVGLLPPNLQGLWAKEIRTPWNGDYHLDVNVQMNHWPVEVSNLGELNLPLADLVGGLVEPGKRTAKAYYQADGWVAHVITNVWGFTEPGESASWGLANAGSGWLCNNLWDHYAFSADKAYLQRIYPILKGSAQFYSSVLMKDPKTGWLVTAPSVSPENTFYLPNGNHASICMGPTIDNQITRELFTNVIEAATVLNVDKGFRDSLQQKLNQIPPPGRIASNGTIMEWLEEYKETDLQHRHISHLYGLYPASVINTTSTPELAEAARKTLNVRGDDGPSWTIAYKLLFWARLKDGNRAYKLLTELLKPTLKTHINYGAGGGVYPNLLSAGPPFQIDGNFGAAAGIGEMLIQSHEGMIELLPAIPDLWGSGEVKGIRARGNITVNMTWKDGRVTNYTLQSPQAQNVKVKVNGAVVEVKTTKIAS